MIFCTMLIGGSVKQRIFAAQFCCYRLFGFEYLLYLFAQILRQDAQLAHEALPARYFKTCGMVAPPHRPIERDVPLQYARAKGGCNERRICSDLMPGVADECFGKFLD